MTSKAVACCTAMLGILLALSGCSLWNNKDQGPMRNDGYRKMLELQKQKAAVTDKEIDVAKKLPEPDAEEMERLGDQYMRQGDMNMAFVYYEKAVRMDAKRSSAHYKMGCLCLSKGMTAEAEREFDEILKNYPVYALAYEGKGQVSLALGKLDAARDQFQEALALNPDLWRAHCFLGIIADRQKKYQEAIGHYHRAIAINPGSHSLFNNLGMSYFLAEENEKALQAFISAEKLDRGNIKIYNNMGLALGKLGRYDESLDAFEKAGNKASAYNNIGCVYLAQKKYRQALTAFQKAIEINPKYYEKARANMTYAEASIKADRPEQQQ